MLNAERAAMENPRRELIFAGPAPGFSVLLKRNCSIAPAALARVFAFLVAVTLGIGIGFAAAGTWLVLPFAGIEVTLLAAAFLTNGRHAADYECIERIGERLTVEISSAGRTERHELAVLAAAFSGLALGLEWNLQPAASPIAADIHGLHEYVMILVTVIFIGVFGFMFWACYAHRKSKGHKAEQFHENTTVEIIWTVIPALILIVIAWPATSVLIAQRDTSKPDLTIKVTGFQWKWGYEYIKGEGEGIH